MTKASTGIDDFNENTAERAALRSPLGDHYPDDVAVSYCALPWVEDQAVSVSDARTDGMSSSAP